MLKKTKEKVGWFLNSFYRNKSQYESIKISLIYFLISFLGVMFSNIIIEKLVNDKEILIIVNTYKEGFLIIATSVVLYILVNNALKKAYLVDKKLNESYEELSAIHEELAASEEELRDQVEELNLAGKELAESKRRLRRTQTIAGSGNWEFDLINQTTWISSEAFKIYGINKKADILPTSLVQSVVLAEDRYKMDLALKNLIEENLKYDVEYRIRRGDNGEVRYIHALAEVEFDSAGKAIRVLGVLQDVTTRIENEIKLQKSYEELSSLYEEIAASEEELKEQVDRLNITSNRLSESERRLNKAQAIGHVGNWEFDVKTNNIWCSTEALRLFWKTNDDGIIPVEYVEQCIDPLDRKSNREAFFLLLDNNVEYNIEYKIINSDTLEERYIHSIAEIEYDKLGNPMKVLGVVKDITNRRNYELELKNNNEELVALYEQIAASEEELRQQLDEILMNRDLLQLSEERYRTLVDNSQDIICSCDLNGVFIAANERFAEISNIPTSKIIGKKLNEIFNNEDLNEEWEKAIETAINTKETVYLENSYYKNTIFNVTVSPIFDIHNEVVGITSTNHNVTEAKKSEQIIRRMAYYDNLTNLPNRVLFADKLKEGIERSIELGTKMAILFIDMDNFKRVNDTLGHAHGDEFLIECARRLESCMRECDIVARLSGDEFSVMIQDIQNPNESLPIIHRILSVFQEPFYIGNSLINMTASIGVSVFPEDGDFAEDLISSADTAMYKAKELGRNGYQFFNVNMKNELIRKLNIEVMLRKAIEKDELVLYYQPQFHGKTKKLRGVEALIRWKNSELGFLSPMEFIPTAEETGLITIIGEWVLYTACCFGKRINDTYGENIIIAVNVSPLQLKHADFYNMVISAIVKSGINPSNLELEVTENIFIDNLEFALNILNDLKQYGIRIALDDFGTGYSSLSYLKKLPIDLLKIDKSFISEIDVLNPRNDFAESIISLVHKLDIEALAEGVENEFQYEYLVNADIDNIQGFYLGKPLPEEEIKKILDLNCLL